MAQTSDHTNRPVIKYVYGELVEGNEEQRYRDALTRERHGATQVERVMRGEEKPADIAADIAHLRKIGVMAPEAEKYLRGKRLNGAGPQMRTSSAEMHMAPGSVVGKGQIDVRARDKITGRAQYSSDVYLPGMLYTKVLRSPHPHAKVTKIDTKAAAALPGVFAVITNADVPTGPAIPRPALSAEPAFAGEPVAAVAAETEAIAEEAIR